MSEPSPTGGRKIDHIRINLEEDVAAKGITTGLERYRFEHQALPDLDFDDVDTGVRFLGHELRIPLLISSMTGGVAEGGRINRNLARAAQACGVAMGLGSGRIALEDITIEKLKDPQFAAEVRAELDAALKGMR